MHSCDYIYLLIIGEQVVLFSLMVCSNVYLGAMCQSNIHKNASIHSVSAKHCIVVTLFT